MKSFIASCLVSVFAFTAHAAVLGPASTTQDPYFAIESISVRELTDAGTPAPSFELPTPQDVEKWVILGKKVWEIVELGRPVANISQNRVSVMPVSEQDWPQMDSWKGPAARVFIIEVTNGLGLKAVEGKFTFTWNYGGRLNGKGAYIANLAMIPSSLRVISGYTFNAKVVVGDAVNVGTKEDPVPGLSYQINWELNSVINRVEGSETFFVDGLGRSKRVMGN